MKHKESNYALPKELSKEMHLSYYERLYEKKELLIKIAVVAVLLVSLFFYLWFRSERKEAESLSLATSYVQKLHSLTKESSEDTTHVTARKERYDQLVTALYELSSKYPQVQNRFSGVVTEAIVLGGISAPISKQAIDRQVDRLHMEGLDNWADFSSLAWLITTKEYTAALTNIDVLIQRAKDENKKDLGPLIACALLQKIAIARETHNETVLQESCAELKKMLLHAGQEESIIQKQDAEQFSECIHEGQKSMLEFMTTKVA